MIATVEIRVSAYAELLAKTLSQPIRSDAEHARIVQTLLALDEPEDPHPEDEALAEVLTLLIEDYEEKHHPLPRVSPTQSLTSLMEERGLNHKGVWPDLGNKGARRRC
jgi:HTH-type transcriptional regulator/antitoxin HigA